MNHNMLVDYLPETVEIEGTEYAIETNFRTFIQTFSSNSVELPLISIPSGYT